MGEATVKTHVTRILSKLHHRNRVQAVVLAYALTPLPKCRKAPLESGADQGFMAVTVGFEPTVGGYPTQLFESCTFGRSDTSPPKSLRHDARSR